MKRKPFKRISFIQSVLNNVYKKLVFLTLLCSLLPLLLVSVISYRLSYRISKNHTIDSLKATNTQIALNIDNRLKQVEPLSGTITFYLYNLYNTPLRPLSSYLKVFSDSKNNLGTIKGTFHLFQIDVFLPEDRYMDAGGNRVDFFPISGIRDYNMTPEALYRQGSSPVWIPNKNLQFPASFSPAPQNVYTCWYAYRDIDNETLHYAFACHIRQQEFSSILANGRNFDAQSFVIDQNGTIVMAADESKICTPFENAGSLWESKDQSFEVDRNLFVVQPVSDRGLLLVTQIPMSYIRQSSNVLLTFLILAIVSIICFSIVLNVSASKIFTRRLDILTRVMESLKASKNRESLSLLIPMTGKPEAARDEIDQLACTYEQMVVENDAYFEKLLELSLQTEKLNFRLLQSQINPHFLFNTLNTIVSCQSLGDIELASQTIINLSQFYRHLLHDPDVLIPFRQELSITELYLKLVSVCKPNVITWDFSVDDGIENFLTCKFIFQPFVENSITHGIADSGQSLHIKIEIRYEEDSLLVRICDNGRGITPEKLRELSDTFGRHVADYSRHFGLGNVNVRLTPYFAPPCTCIQVESSGGGTVFSFYLKQIYKEDSHDLPDTDY